MNRRQPKKRCAIYTRKSTEEGLDQQFNSLVAQREACSAYVMSQQHEGWELVDAQFDDGGFSGGSPDRPGLQSLLEEVRAGRIDVVVVYKVDRLTRSLADFAKIVEILDEAQASFVSVTQAFNTTNSMGRLTLNVLLSFAQFEREVTAERIRDKIAASRKKGMWTGGPVPLGYHVKDRKLIVNEAEAEIVRLIFERHRELGSLTALVDDLTARGLRTKRRPCRNGRVLGDVPFTWSALKHLLSNSIYVGLIRQGDQTHPGQHKAIVDQESWDTSQALLQSASKSRGVRNISPLTGRIRDGEGRKLYAVHTGKGRKRYRYYTDKTQDSGGAWRLPAGDIERLVTSELTKLLSDENRIAEAFGQEKLDDGSALKVRPAMTFNLQKMAEALDAHIVVETNKLEMLLRREKLAGLFGYEISPDLAQQSFVVSVPATLRKRGHELRIVERSKSPTPTRRDESLILLLRKRRAAWEKILAEAKSIPPKERSELVRYARLNFLSPDVVTAIVNGAQPVTLTARTLMRTANLPISWTEQRTILGFTD